MAIDMTKTYIDSLGLWECHLDDTDSDICYLSKYIGHNTEIVFGKENNTITIDKISKTYSNLVFESYALKDSKANTITIKIYSNVKEIQDYAFAESSLKTALIYDEEIEKYGEYIFFNCIELTGFEWYTKNITKGSFAGCSSLQDLRFFSPNLRTIGEYAFQESGLKTILIPYTLEEIKDYAFFDCKNLEEFDALKSDNLIKIGNNVFADCVKLKNILLPNSVIEIGEGCFAECLSLKEIRLPENLTTINDYAFAECPLLDSIYIPTNINYIGNYVFEQCVGLNSIVIFDNVQSIGEKIFYKCSDNLTIYLYKDSYIETYCRDNNYRFSYIVTTSNNERKIGVSQYFLAGVANVEIFKGNDLFSTAKTLIDSSITIGVTGEDIRAGQGAKLYGKYFHSSTFDIKMTDAMFKMEYIAANIGADLEMGGDVFKVENVVSQKNIIDEYGYVDETFVLKNIPKAMGNSDLVYVYYKEDTEEYFKYITLTKQEAETKRIVIPTKGIGHIYCIKYLYTNDSARTIIVKSNFTPDTLSVYLTANLYQGDISDKNSGSRIGTLTIKIPRFILNGNQEIAMSMTGSTNMTLEGSALATTYCGCHDGVYAEIIEVIDKRKLDDLIELMVEDSDDVIYLYKNEKYKIKVYGKYSNTYFAKMQNRILDFKFDKDYFIIDEDGVLVGVKKTDNTPQRIDVFYNRKDGTFLSNSLYVVIE